jgi:hypothetical protein
MLQPAVNEKMLDTTNFAASLIEMRADGEACARCARFRLQRAHASQHPITHASTHAVGPLSVFPGAGYKTYYNTHEKTGVLLVAMICFPDAIEDHAADPGSTVDVIDSTFNTNRYNYKLSLTTTVRRDGKTRIKAITLMLFEDKESFVAMFEWYHDAFGSFPNAIISDGDIALHSAIVDAIGQDYADTRHKLCVWHESKVVVKHIKHVFGAAVSGRRGSGSNEPQWNVFIRTCPARRAPRDRLSTHSALSVPCRAPLCCA